MSGRRSSRRNLTRFSARSRHLSRRSGVCLHLTMSLSANNLERRGEYHEPYYRRFEVSFYCRVTHCSSCGYRVASHRNGRIECCSIMCSLSGYTSERRGAVVGAIRIVGSAETPSASLGRFLLRPPLNFSDGGLLVQRLYSMDGRWNVVPAHFVSTLSRCRDTVD